MDKEILLGNNTLVLTQFRSFMFKNEKYTIFVDAKVMDDGMPAIYVLKNENGEYTVPDRETLTLLLPLCSDIICNTEPFDSENKNYPKIDLLPWNE